MSLDTIVSFCCAHCNVKVSLVSILASIYFPSSKPSKNAHGPKAPLLFWSRTVPVLKTSYLTIKCNFQYIILLEKVRLIFKYICV